jgi:outer membrane protein assembly factor BamD
MRKIFSNIILLSTVSVLFFGCSQKSSSGSQEYNKPAIYWYNKMTKQISTYNLDEADDTFTSLESEHRNSPLLPSAMMIIATAHMEEEEYEMANYYFDEYLKRFSLKKDADYIRYLKIKSNFLAFSRQFREQKLLAETLEQTNEFILKYPGSEYIHLVQTMKSRLLMAQALFNKEIAELYGRIDKPNAKKIYEDKAEKKWENYEQIEKPDIPWYKSIFE